MGSAFRRDGFLKDATLRKRAAPLLGGGPVLPDKPAESYYEWQKTEDGKKIPNYLYSENDPLLGFAALYEWWADPSLAEDDPERWLLVAHC